MSKIGSALGMESKARARKGGADVAKAAGTKIPRMLWDTFGGSEIPILEGAFAKWEDKRNRYADAKNRKKGVDAKYHKDPAGTPDKSAKDMVNEARKSREDAKQASQAQAAHQNKADAYNSAVADQGSSQIKILAAIKDELSEIKGVLSIGGKKVRGGQEGEQTSGLGTLWNLLPASWKGKIGGKAADIAEKFGGKKIGSLIRGATTLAGGEVAEKVAAGSLGAAAKTVAPEVAEKVATNAAEHVAGAGIGAAAKTVAPEAAGAAVKAASGGILGKITGFGKSALGAASGAIDSGKAAIGKVGGFFGGAAGKVGEEGIGAAAGKVGGKAAEEGVGKVAGKLGGKLLAKEGAKAIPLLGNVIGLATSIGFAGKRLFEGDIAGAGMEAGSGLLNLIPGVGNYLSIAADLAIAGRDLKKANSVAKLTEGVGKAAEKEGGAKTAKEISEEAAKVVEEKTKGDEEGSEDDVADTDGKKKEKPGKLSQLASQLSPIQDAKADDVPVPRRPGKVLNGITKAGVVVGGSAALTASASPTSVAALRTSTKASPMDRLVGYMAGLFDLASDDTKGLYVRASKALDAQPSGSTTSAPSPIPAPASSSGPVSSSVTPSYSSGNSSSSSVSPVSSGSGGGSAGLQPGAASNGGWVSGNGGAGTLSINEAGGGSTGGASASSVGAAPKSYGKSDGYDIDGLWEQMKGTIAQGESGKAGYNAHNGGTIDNLTGMTIGQLKKMKGAMGKYQLLPGTTLGMAARAVGLGDNDLFSAANQESMGKYLFAMRVKRGAKGGAAGIQQQLALEWASLPKDASGKGAYDGYAGNMAAGGAARGSSIASTISSGGAGAGSVSSAGGTGTADAIDAATNDVAKSDSSGNPMVVVQPSGPSGGGGGNGNAAAGTGGGASGPMITRNSDSSVQSITQNFISGSSAI